MNGIAFVGSTLPTRIVAMKARAGEIGTVLTSAPSLEPSFQYLRQQTPSLSVGSLPHAPIKQALSLLAILIKARLSGRQIYIFHESCWPVMDLMIWLVRPTGWFLPQANMLSFTRLPEGEAREVLRQKRFGRILAGPMSRLFWVYACPNDACDGMLHVPAIRHYPSSMQCSDESELISTSVGAPTASHADSDTMLFLVGTEPVETSSLRRMYEVLIQAVRSSGFRVDVKDHPNQDARLNLTIDDPDVTLLDPTLPAELLHKGYRCAVGVGSAGLVTFGPRAISIVDLLDDMEDEVKALRKRYLLSLNPQTVFVTSIEQFVCFIEQPSAQPEPASKEGRP